MQVFIARGGKEIGKYARADLEGLIADGTLRASDYYWHDGMEDWRKLSDLLGEKSGARKTKPSRAPVATIGEPAAEPQPELPAPKPLTIRECIELWKTELRNRRRQLLWFGVGVLLFFLVAAIAIHFVNVNHARPVPVATEEKNSANPTGVGDLELRDRAAADLRQRIDRLPAKATPPLNTFYYGVRVEMQETFSEASPWRATVHGVEDVVDPETQATVRHTDFLLTTEYRHGAWTFVLYRASSTDLVRELTTEIQDDPRTMTPPSLVGMLGLKRDAL